MGYPLTSFRPATPADIPAFLEMIRNVDDPSLLVGPCRHDGVGRSASQVPDHDFFNTVLRSPTGPLGYRYTSVIELDDQVAGFGVMVPLERLEGVLLGTVLPVEVAKARYGDLSEVIDFHLMVVDPALHDARPSIPLVHWCLGEARRQGFRHMVGQRWDCHVRSARFFEKHGGMRPFHSVEARIDDETDLHRPQARRRRGAVMKGFVALAFSAMTFAAVPTVAGGFPEADLSPPITVNDTPVLDAVATLLQRYDIPLRRMAEDIEGEISGRLGDATPAALLDRLGALHGFYWYYDGRYVEVGKAEEVGAETLQLPPERGEEFLADLDALGMAFPQFPLGVNEATGVIVLRGPESLRAVIRDLAARYAPLPPAAVAAPPERQPARVIYGRPHDPSWVYRWEQR